MRSSNPILTGQNTWRSQGSAQQQGQWGGQQHGQWGQPQDQWGGQQQWQGQGPVQQEPRGGVMTLDDVITKSGVVLGLMILVAAATFVLVPPEIKMVAGMVCGLGMFVLSFMVALRSKVSAPLVLAGSVLEGVFVGAMSYLFESYYPGIVVQAVLGTFAAAAVTLAAYKFGRIRVTPQFTRIVLIATLAFAVAMLLNFLLSFAGINLGLVGGMTGQVGWLPIAMAGLGVVLGVFNLVIDFDAIESGVRMRAPATQSWVAAFGLMVTMVWLYINLLRIISYLRR